MERPVSPKQKADQREALNGLTAATRAAYSKLAENFYEHRVSGQPSPKRVADALKNCASEYRPAYWRKLRNALMYDQVSKGYHDAASRIGATRNPVTAAGGEVKKKQRRIKSVSDADHSKLSQEAMKDEDQAVFSAMLIARYVGCRPAEMLSVSDAGNNRVAIEGAKKSKGNRGLDRVVELDPALHKLVLYSVARLREAEPGKSGIMHKVQSRMDRLCKRLWPRRAAHITLYSFRHQLGGDLKASSMSRTEIAYVMGHQSTKSVEVYGDRRKGGKTAVKPALGADMSMIRENHSAPGPKAPTPPSRDYGRSGPSI